MAYSAVFGFGYGCWAAAAIIAATLRPAEHRGDLRAADSSRGRRGSLGPLSEANLRRDGVYALRGGRSGFAGRRDRRHRLHETTRLTIAAAACKNRRD